MLNNSDIPPNNFACVDFWDSSRELIAISMVINTVLMESEPISEYSIRTANQEVADGSARFSGLKDLRRTQQKDLGLFV